MRKYQSVLANTRIAAIATLGLINLAWNAHAQQAGFSTDSLNGDYVLTERGSLGPSAQLASLGRYTFDGKGNVTGFQIMRAAGVSLTTTCVGTYTLDADGNGTISLVHTTPLLDSDGENVTTTANYRFLVSSAGSTNQLRAIRTENGVTIGTDFSKVPAGSVSPLRGRFVMYEDGTVGSSSSLAGLGMITFDGNGGVTGNESVNTSTTNLTTSFTGSYSIDANGVGTLTLVHTLPGPVPEGEEPATATANYTFIFAGGKLQAIRSENTIAVSTQFDAR